jgi:hypothetical protein
MSISSSAINNSLYTNPAKGSSRLPDPASTYVGVVTRIIGSQVILQIPKLNSVIEFGPCDVYCEFPQLGDSVLCSYIDGRFDHIVVFAKQNLLTTSAESVMENRVFD